MIFDKDHMIKLLKIVGKILWDIARNRSMWGEIDQHHGYWWPGSLRRQAISGNSIANVIVMTTTSGTSIITLGVQCTGHLYQYYNFGGSVYRPSADVQLVRRPSHSYWWQYIGRTRHVTSTSIRFRGYPHGTTSYLFGIGEGDHWSTN